MSLVTRVLKNSTSASLVLQPIFILTLGSVRPLQSWASLLVGRHDSSHRAKKTTIMFVFVKTTHRTTKQSHQTESHSEGSLNQGPGQIANPCLVHHEIRHQHGRLTSAPRSHCVFKEYKIVCIHFKTALFATLTRLAATHASPSTSRSTRRLPRRVAPVGSERKYSPSTQERPGHLL